jgi:HK97 family phage portal protein
MAGQISAYALEMLRRGPSGYLKVNAPELTKPKAKTLQDDWEAAHGGYRRRVAVLNATTEFHKLQLDPVALELAKMRDYSTLDIALVFGVPPYMLGLTAASDTYANVESRMIELAQFTLYPWARRAESTHDAELPAGTDMRINMAGLLRADTLTRYQAHKIAYDAEFLTTDEIRELEDRPPMAAQVAIEADNARRGLRVVNSAGGGPQ